MATVSVPAAIFGVYVLTLLENWLGSDFDDAVYRRSSPGRCS